MRHCCTCSYWLDVCVLLCCRTSGLWGNCCTTSPGPTWENWYLWWVRCTITPFSTHSPEKHFSSVPCFVLFLFFFLMLIPAMTKPKHPLAYGDVYESLAPAQGCGNFYARLLFSTLLFYLSPASPLELIRDLERLSLHAHTHADTVYIFSCNQQQYFLSFGILASWFIHFINYDWCPCAP